MKHSLLRLFTFCSLLFAITACTGQTTPSPTPITISMALATVYISPTPNDAEAEASRAAVTSTSIPPSPTVIPTETPYVGIFLGEAEAEESFVEFTEPIFGPEQVIGEPTANAERCISNPIDTPYLTAWRTNPTVNQRLGCPIQGGFGLFGQVQIFETGVMYYYPELNAVWAIRPLLNGNRGQYDYLENPPDASTIGIQPDAGLIVPGDVFGDMWLAVDGLRSQMGFARTEAQEVPLGLQRFENGTFLLDASAGQVYALVTDGTVFGPFLAPEVTPGLVSTPTLPAFEITETPEEPQG